MYRSIYRRVPALTRTNLGIQTHRLFSTKPPPPPPLQSLVLKPIPIAAGLTAAASLLFINRPVVEAEPSGPLVPHSPASTTVAELLDDQSRVVMQAKTSSELLLALFVYKLCSFTWLVDAAPQIIQLAEKVGMETPVYYVIRNTFFRHFCGGENPEECLEAMNRLSRSGIDCIFDLSVEADLADGSPSLDQQEAMADKITRMTEHSIRTASQGSSVAGAFAAIKITAFASPALLLRLNQAIASLQLSFQEHQKLGKIDAEGIETIIDKLLPADSDEHKVMRAQVVQRLRQENLNLDRIEFTRLFDLQGEYRDIWWKAPPGKGLLDPEELKAYDRMVTRLERVCSLGQRLKTGIMVDAEQSYFQEAIDYIAMNLQEKYNKRTSDNDSGPVVFNTYQMYTKAAQGKLELDVERAGRNNFTFAAKLVRGAYMVSERKRAQQLNYPSPIHDSLEDTHASYNAGISFLLSKLQAFQKATGEPVKASNSPVVFMVASHNRDSIILTIQEMEKSNVSRHAGVVHFGQLFGMQDPISYTLGRHGYSIYKYLPYGAIHEVIPYLLRRAQENSAVLGGVTKERALMAAELKDRLVGNNVSPKPTVPRPSTA
ncbi:FAD-linked oxidoreductase-like protein [Phycomyces nitens]|nr:FAD-linked oxidoreductase-like protein [Phycomyces nitens]